jgi:CMP-N-acetylneuraminic acid synthetase
MKTIAVIPLRKNSKGCPGKNFAMIAGKPMFFYALEAANEAKTIDEIIVASDDDHIFYLMNMGNFIYRKVVHTVYLSDDITGDDVPVDKVLHYVSQSLDKNDIVVHIQATSPLIKPVFLDIGVSEFLKNEYDSMFSAIACDDILIWEKESMQPINYDLNNRGTRQKRKITHYIESGMFYITKAQHLQNGKPRLSGKIGMVEVPKSTIVEVDTLEDLEMIRKIMQ